MDDLGPLMRVLRKERGFTLKTLSEGIVSFSYLSKFENGESQISLNNFIRLAQRLNLTVDEILYFNQIKMNDYTDFYQKISVAHIQQDVAKLKDYFAEENKLYQNHQIKFHQYNAVMIAAVIKDLEDDFQIPAEDVQELVDYLMACSSWTSYEIGLFGNSLSLFTDELLMLLLEETKQKLIDYRVMRKSFRDLIRLVQNAALIFLRKGKIEKASELSSFLAEVIASDQYFESTRQLFIDGAILLASEQEKEGLNKVQQALTIMDVLDEKLANNHRLELRHLQEFYN